MYLGLKEMRRERLRFSLLTGLMLLIALVVFMLAGLADGLSQGNRLAIDQWHASAIYLNRDANKNISASQLTTAASTDVSGSKQAQVAVQSTVLRKANSSQKINVSLLATEKNAFLLPKLTGGQHFSAINQVIISQNLRDQGVKIGDKIQLGSNKNWLTVVGSYGNNTLSIAPTLYTNLDTMAKLKAIGAPVSQPLPINAIVTKGQSHLTSNTYNLQKLSMPTFIQNLPGYSAEQSTLNTMIYFLFAMSLAIIGIFMYILTLQKRSLFAVMKVEGISTRHILASVLTQALLMGFVAVLLGLVITIGFGAIAPAGMPFVLEISQLLIYGLSLLLAAFFGALLSWPTIAKINPVSAIN